jgi:hypothetical protein
VRVRYTFDSERIADVARGLFRARTRRKHLQQNPGAVWPTSYAEALEPGSMTLQVGCLP